MSASAGFSLFLNEDKILKLVHVVAFALFGKITVYWWTKQWNLSCQAVS